MADNREFKSMQEDAIRRVQEMQRKSKSYVGGAPDETPPPTPASVQNSSPPKPQEPPKSNTLFNIGGIKIDEEKALIALLIYILYKNKADMKLLLALGYLLL